MRVDAQPMHARLHTTKKSPLCSYFGDSMPPPKTLHENHVEDCLVSVGIYASRFPLMSACSQHLQSIPLLSQSAILLSRTLASIIILPKSLDTEKHVFRVQHPCARGYLPLVHRHYFRSTKRIFQTLDQDCSNPSQRPPSSFKPHTKTHCLGIGYSKLHLRECHLHARGCWSTGYPLRCHLST